MSHLLCLTIPKHVLNELGLQRGDVVLFDVRKGKVSCPRRDRRRKDKMEVVSSGAFRRVLEGAYPEAIVNFIIIRSS